MYSPFLFIQAEFCTISVDIPSRYLHVPPSFCRWPSGALRASLFPPEPGTLCCLTVSIPSNAFLSTIARQITNIRLPPPNAAARS